MESKAVRSSASSESLAEDSSPAVELRMPAHWCSPFACRAGTCGNDQRVTILLFFCRVVVRLALALPAHLDAFAQTLEHTLVILFAYLLCRLRANLPERPRPVVQRAFMSALRCNLFQQNVVADVPQQVSHLRVADSRISSTHSSLWMSPLITVSSTVNLMLFLMETRSRLL